MSTTAQQTVTPAIKKYLDIIESGTIQEGQILAMKAYMNKNEEGAYQIMSGIYDNELKISDVQTKKGLDFLLGQCKTPRGSERKNNPFGGREQCILKRFKRFTLVGFQNIGNQHAFFVPTYKCYDQDGYSFSYYYNGKVNIL